MSHVPRALTILSLALGAWLLVLAVGKSSENAAVLATLAEQKEANAALVEQGYRDRRADSARFTARLRAAAAAERKLAARLDATLATSALAVDSAGAVLADPTANNVALRYTLAMTAERLDSMVSVVRLYRTSADTLAASHSIERARLLSLLSSADTVIAAKNLALTGWRNAARCTIVFGIKCPTRTQSAVGGALLALGVIVAVR